MNLGVTSWCPPTRPFWNEIISPAFTPIFEVYLYPDASGLGTPFGAIYPFDIVAEGIVSIVDIFTTSLTLTKGFFSISFASSVNAS